MKLIKEMFYYELRTSFENESLNFTQPFFSIKYMETEEEVIKEAIKHSAITELEAKNVIEVTDLSKDDYEIIYNKRQDIA